MAAAAAITVPPAGERFVPAPLFRHAALRGAAWSFELEAPAAVTAAQSRAGSLLGGAAGGGGGSSSLPRALDLVALPARSASGSEGVGFDARSGLFQEWEVRWPAWAPVVLGLDGQQPARGLPARSRDPAAASAPLSASGVSDADAVLASWLRAARGPAVVSPSVLLALPPL